MDTPDPDTLVQRFIDGDLSEAEVEAALHRIADDAEARDLLRFELRMTQDFAASRSPAPPPEFASETVEALPPASDARDSSPVSLGDWLQGLWRRATRPVTVPVRPAYALVPILLLSAMAWVLWPVAPSSTGGGSSVEPVQSTPSATSSQPVASESAAPDDRKTVWIRFLYPDNDADSVAVAGDFNQWQPISLTPRTVDGRTVWTGLVPVPRGEHEYQFVIDGDRWVPDPLAPETRSDGFGAQNAVLEV